MSPRPKPPEEKFVKHHLSFSPEVDKAMREQATKRRETLSGYLARLVIEDGKKGRAK